MEKTEEEMEIEAKLDELIHDIRALPLDNIQQFEAFMRLATLVSTLACDGLRSSEPLYAAVTDQELIDAYVTYEQSAMGAHSHSQQAADAAKWVM